jgi:hypothetical protein
VFSERTKRDVVLHATLASQASRQRAERETTSD